MPFPTLTPPPAAPDRTSGSFSTQADAFVAWWAVSQAELTAWAAYANGLALVTGSYQFADGAAATPGITFASDTDTGFYRVSANTIGVVTAGTENFRILSGGNLRLCVQANGVAAFPSGLSGALQVQGLAGIANVAVHRASADTAAPQLILSKSRGTTAGDSTIVQAGDFLAQISAFGGDGTTQFQAAQIRAVVSGTPAAGDIRAEWRFATYNGSALANALIIDANGDTTINGVLKKGANQVVGARATGWTAWTGTANRATKATGSATLADVAQTVKALIDDLIAHGLIGT